MATALKHLINPEILVHAATHLQRAWPAFNPRRFLQTAGKGLAELEFKARAMQIADALQLCLPDDFDTAATVIEQALAPPLAFDAKGEPVGLGDALNAEGLSGWVLWGVGEYVSRQGRHHVPRALACLHALTQRFTAEFAIRSLIEAQPSPVFDALARWTNDPSPHVRRLVSEGSRPRLPWGLRLRAQVADPQRSLQLLHSLQDDSSAYVRRSVANHLNDIAKDHPDIVAQWLREHLPGASAERMALLRHASRSLIKQGHAPTLVVWGLRLGMRAQATLLISPTAVALGDQLELHVQLRSSVTTPQTLVVDYAVHHVRANDQTTAKVFKGWKLALAPGATLTLAKRHALRQLSTRRLYPGRHRVDLLVNGQTQASAHFDLLAEA